MLIFFIDIKNSDIFNYSISEYLLISHLFFHSRQSHNLGWKAESAHGRKEVGFEAILFGGNR